MEEVEVYVDGSFKNGRASWAFAVIKDGAVISEAAGIITDKEINKGHQIGGECAAVINALKWAAKNNKSLIVYYDYVGLKNWIADLINPRHRPWARNRSYTEAYRRFCLNHKNHIKKFIKVKGHSGNKWNEYVDKLAGKVNKPA